MNLTLLIVGMLVVGLVLVMFQYSKLVGFKNKVEDSWSRIEVPLKARYDLLPSLMEMVEVYTNQEKAVFEKITVAHHQAISAGNVADQAFAENMLSQSLKSLFAISENYPDLKASEKFRDFQQQLSDVEDEIQLSRRYYNATVQENNTSTEKFPTILIAGPLGFGSFDYFEI